MIEYDDARRIAKAYRDIGLDVFAMSFKKREEEQERNYVVAHMDDGSTGDILSGHIDICRIRRHNEPYVGARVRLNIKEGEWSKVATNLFHGVKGTVVGTAPNVGMGFVSHKTLTPIWLVKFDTKLSRESSELLKDLSSYHFGSNDLIVLTDEVSPRQYNKTRKRAPNNLKNVPKVRMPR